MPFPTAQQANLQICPPHYPFNAERQAGKLEYQFSSHWFDRTQKRTRSTAPDADVLSTRPSELLKYNSL